MSLSDRPPVKTFYVTGLPRCRTAWLAVALSDYRKSACLHEPLTKLRSFDGPTVKALFEAQKTQYAGLSDSGLPVIAPDLLTELPGPSIVVWRDPLEVARSLSGYLGNDLDTNLGLIAVLVTKLKEFADRYHPLLVSFEDLGSTDAMRLVWHHLLPELPFPRRRIEALQRMQINPVKSTLLDGLTAEAEQRIRETTTA